MKLHKLRKILTRSLFVVAGIFLISTTASALLRPRSVAVSPPASLPLRTPWVTTSTTMLSPTATVTAETPFFPVERDPEAHLRSGIWAEWQGDSMVPEHASYEPGISLTKTWRLANVGQTSWPTDTVLTFIEGEDLSAPLTVSVGSVAPNVYADISVGLQTPEYDGTFVGQWALTTGGNVIPGSEVWLIVVVGDGQALATPVPKGPFELGGHIFQDFEHAEEMRYAGMTWVKVQARYPESEYAETIAQAHAQGFKILVSAVGEANMVTEPNFSSRFAEWVSAIAASGADAVEVWNEPNLPREWAKGYISPGAYTRLLCGVSAAVRRANPGTLVISAAPAPTGFFRGCNTEGCDDVPWLQALYDAGAAGCLDYVGAHHNAGATSPSATTGHPADPGGSHHSWYFLPQTYRYYEAFQRTRRIFYTELGYLSSEGFSWTPEAFSWATSTRVAQQAAWLAEAARLSREIGVVRAMIVWNVDATCYGDCGGGEDPQAGYAIIRRDGSCPACETLHDAMNLESSQ